MPQEAKVVVEGIAMVKRHVKKAGANQSGRIVERPRAIHISTVMVQDPKEKKGTRVRREVKDGVRTRVAIKSGTTLS
jgi:large subunit ribosomal protein L24